MMIPPNPRTNPSKNPEGREALIRELTEGITPVTRVRPLHGALMIAIGASIAAIGAVAIFGFWSGMLTGEASGHFWITNGLLLLLGLSSAAALIASAMPRVGSRSDTPVWTAAMAAVVPIAALIALLFEEAHGATGFAEPELAYWECGLYVLIGAGAVAVTAIAFLRRGAPVSLERAGWLTGLASGAFGALACGLICNLDGLAHLGIWHVAPVGVAAVIGRLVVPKLIRW